jgi:hypothetical protein
MEALAVRFKEAIEVQVASTIGQAAGAPWKVAQVDSSLVVTLFGDREMTGVQRQPSGGATWVRISSRT